MTRKSKLTRTEQLRRKLITQKIKLANRITSLKAKEESLEEMKRLQTQEARVMSQLSIFNVS